MQDKKEQAVIDIINKMFEIAGHKVTYDDIKDRQDDWYAQWTMTQEQGKEWFDWGVGYIQKKLKYSKNLAASQMGMILLNYGLKYQEKQY